MNACRYAVLFPHNIEMLILRIRIKINIHWALSQLRNWVYGSRPTLHAPSSPSSQWTDTVHCGERENAIKLIVFCVHVCCCVWYVAKDLRYFFFSFAVNLIMAKVSSSLARNCRRCALVFMSTISKQRAKLMWTVWSIILCADRKLLFVTHRPFFTFTYLHWKRSNTLQYIFSDVLLQCFTFTHLLQIELHFVSARVICVFCVELP